jgi:hypothetical protein
MAVTVTGEIEMKYEKLQAAYRAQREELKKLKAEFKEAQAEAKKTGDSLDKAGDSLNKQARRARSDLAVFGAQGRVIGQFAQGFTSLAGPVGLVGAAVMGVGVAWSAVSSEIEEAKKRAEEFKKSMDKLDEGAVKESGSRATEAQKAAESNAGLALIYKDPEKIKRDVQKRFGFTQEQAGGIMAATSVQVRKLQPEKRDEAIQGIFTAALAAQLSGIDPVAAAKELASNRPAMSAALKGADYKSASLIASSIYGFRVSPDEIKENASRQLKRQEIVTGLMERQMAAPKEPIASPFDIERKRIENRRKFLEGSIRSGDDAAKILEEQQKQLREFNTPWYKESLPELFGMRGQSPGAAQYYLGPEQAAQRTALEKRLSEQNPDVDPGKIAAILSEMTEVIRLNTLSNSELKKSLDANNDKTKENTSATKDATSEGATGLKK